MWRRLAGAALWPHERLFFEMYARALQGEPGTTALLDDIVDASLDPLTDLVVMYEAQIGGLRTSP